MSWDEDVRNLRLGGATDVDIAGLASRREATLRQGGFTGDQVDDYFGRRRAEVSPAFVQRFGENVAAARAAAPDQSFSFKDAMNAGWQSSIFGLASRKAMPDITLPENASLAKRFVANSTQWLFDTPWMAVGGIGGALAGGALGGAEGTAAPVIGPATPLAAAVTGATIGGGAGSFALPAFVRRELMEHYSRGTANDWSDFFTVHGAATADALKEGVVGALTAGAGGVAKAALGPLGYVAGGAVRTAGTQAAEVATMVTATKAMEGKVPTAQDFLDASIMVGAMHIAAPVVSAGTGYVSDVAGKLRAVYARTGITPHEIVPEAEQRPELKQALHDKGDNHIQIGAMLGAPDVVNDAQPVTGAGAAAEAESAQVGHPNDVAVGEALNDAVPPYDGKAPEDVPAAATAQAASMSPDFSPEAPIASVKPEQPAPVTLRGEDYPQLTGKGKKFSTSMAAKTLDYAFNRDVGLAQDEGRVVPAELRKQLAAQQGHLEGMPDALAAYKAGSKKPDALVAGDVARRVKLLKDVLAARGEPEVVESEKSTPAEAPPGEPPAEPPNTPEEPAKNEPPPGEKWTPEQASDHIGRQINTDGEPPDPRDWKTRFRDTWRNFYKSAWDGIYPILSLDRDLAGQKISEAASKAYSRMRAMAGIFDKSSSIIENGPIDYATKERIPGVKGLPAILKSVPDVDTLRKYAVASRAIEKAGQGIETGVNVDAAKVFTDANRDTYEPAFRDLVKFQEGVMQYLIDSGVVSQEKAGVFREANKDFVPFHRLVEGLSSGNSLKEMKGSTRAIIDPLQTIIKNVHAFTHMADMNEVKGALVARAEEAGTGQGLFERIPSTVDTDKLQALIDGFAEQDPSFAGMRAKDLVAFAPVGDPRTDVRYLRDGKPEVYRTTPDVASILNGTDREQLPAIWKIASFPARLERAGILSAPSFMVRHGIRNPIMAMFYTHNGMMPWDLARGLAAYVGGGKDFTDALAGGMGQRVSDILDRNYLQKNVFELSKQTGLMDTVINAVKNPAEAMHAVASISDGAIRMAEYLKARAAGKGIPDAAFDARRVIPDASRAGAGMRAISSVVPFFHMEWQGMDMFWRAAIENPARYGFAAASIAAVSALVWGLGKNDSRIDEIPEHERDLFWCVPTDDWRPIDQTNENALIAAMARPEDQRREINGQLYTNEGAVFRIPKPFQAGIIFGSGTERALDAYSKQNPDAFRGFGRSIAESVYRAPIPAFAKPMIEQFANKSTFTGNPIVPESVMRELPEYRYTDATSEPAKQIAQFIATVPAIGRDIAVSPMVIDNYIKSWSGDAGAYALDLLTRGMHAAGVGEQPPPQPSGHELIGGLEDNVPFVRAFVVRHPSASARSIQQFHDADAEYQMIKATMINRAKEGDTDALSKLEAMQSREYAGVDLGAVHTSMANQAHAIRLINESREMSPVEKRQSIDGLYYMMASSAQAANQTLRQARAAAEAP